MSEYVWVKEGVCLTAVAMVQQPHSVLLWVYTLPRLVCICALKLFRNLCSRDGVRTPLPPANPMISRFGSWDCGR